MILPTFDLKIAKDHFDTLTGPFNAKKVKLLIGSACPVIAQDDDKCAKKPSELVGECETKKEVSNCMEVVRQGVQQHCAIFKTSPACAWLPTTTPSPTTDIANQLIKDTSESTTSTSNNLPIIIGAVVGVVLLIAIAIGIFFYCRKKGKKGGQTTGTTTGGTTGTTQQSGMSATTSGRSKKSTMV